MFQQRLRAAGQEVSEDEDDEDDENDDEEDEEDNDEGTNNQRVNGAKVGEIEDEQTEGSPCGVDEEKKLLTEEKPDNDGFREDSQLFVHSEGKLELFNESEYDQDLETPIELQ